jgi:hypothetical protein
MLKLCNLSELLCRSNIDIVAHQSAGLIGPIIITAADMADADAKPIDVTTEFVVMFYVSHLPHLRSSCLIAMPLSSPAGRARTCLLASLGLNSSKKMSFAPSVR